MAGVVQALRALLGGGAAERAAAESYIDGLERSDRSALVGALLGAACGDGDAGVGEPEAALAAVILSNRLPRLLHSLPLGEQQALMRRVAAALVAGADAGRPAPGLRQLAGLCSALAQSRAAAADTVDPELLAACSRLVESRHHHVRACGWDFVTALLDGLGARLAPLYAQLLPPLTAACGGSEANPVARAEALRCAGVLLGSWVWTDVPGGEAGAAACGGLAAAVLAAAGTQPGSEDEVSVTALGALAPAASRLQPPLLAAARQRAAAALLHGGEEEAAAGAAALAGLAAAADDPGGSVSAGAAAALLHAAERPGAPGGLRAACRAALGSVLQACDEGARVAAVTPVVRAVATSRSAASFELLAAAAEPAAEALSAAAPHALAACAEAMAACSEAAAREAGAEAIAALAQAFAPPPDGDSEDEGAGGAHGSAALPQGAHAAALPTLCRCLGAERDGDCARAEAAAVGALCFEMDSSEAAEKARDAVPPLLGALQAGPAADPVVTVSLLRALASIGLAAGSFAGRCAAVAAGVAPLLDAAPRPPSLRAAALEAAAAVVHVAAGEGSTGPDAVPASFTAIAAQAASAALSAGTVGDDLVLAGALRFAGCAAQACGEHAAPLAHAALHCSTEVLAAAHHGEVQTGTRELEERAADCIGQMASGAPAAFAAVAQGGGAAAAVAALTRALASGHARLVGRAALALEHVVRSHAPAGAQQGCPEWVAAAAATLLRLLEGKPGRSHRFLRDGWSHAQWCLQVAANACVERMPAAHPLVAPLKAAAKLS